MQYISVDIETTGLNPEICKIIQFAAVIDNGAPLEELPRFEKLLLQLNGVYPFNLQALEMNRNIVAKISEIQSKIKDKQTQLLSNWCYDYELVDHFLCFIARHGLKHEKITFAGKNFANFDLRFLEKLPGWCKVNMHHRIIDPGSMFMLPTDPGLPDLKTCLERCGLPNAIAHNALDDALQVVQVIRKSLESYEKHSN